MKKICAGILTVTMVLAMCLAGQAAQSAYRIKIAHLLAESDDAHQGYLALKKMLEERSGGRFNVQIFPNATLGATDEEHAELVNTNAVQISLCGFFSLPNINHSLGHFAVMDLPYLFRTDAEYYAFIDSDYGKAMLRDVLQKTGNILINTSFLRSWQCLTTTKTPVYTPSDLRNLKILSQSPKVFQSTVAAWGGNVTSIPFAEIYTAMQQGAVDGHLRPINLHISQRFYEVQKYVTLVNQCGMVVCSLVSNRFVESLPPDLKEIFLASLADYEQIMRKFGETRQVESVKQMADAGLTVIEPTREQRQQWIDASQPVFAAMEDVIGKDVIMKAKEIIAPLRK